MLLKDQTKQHQSELANYCRDGELVEIEGAKIDRLPHYRRLVYNVMYGLQEKSYPILKSVLTEPEFKSMINAFMTEHDSQSPQVWKVPGEFFEFVDQHDLEIKREYPYMRDLMLMEWLEILVYNRMEKDIPDHVYQNPQMQDQLVLNPDFEMHGIDYPVHKGDWETISEKKGNYFLLLFRNLQSKKVHFVEISALHFDLINAIQERETLANAFQLVMDKYQLSGSNVEDQLMNFIYGLYNDGFILGAAQS